MTTLAEILAYIDGIAAPITKLTPTQIDDVAAVLLKIALKAAQSYKQVKGEPIDPAALGQLPLIPEPPE